MADERTLALERPADLSPDEPSKAELQRRMDEARDSISQTVAEIKDTMVHQYETVKETINETLDWREQYKKRPVAWSLGAVGGGFLVGYGIAAVVKGESRQLPHYNGSAAPAPPARLRASTAPVELRELAPQPSGPGLVERFQETAAYNHLKDEAAVVGKRFVGELSQTAQEVVLPAAVAWVRQWLSGLMETKNTPPKASNPPITQTSQIS